MALLIFSKKTIFVSVHASMSLWMMERSGKYKVIVNEENP